MKFFKAIDFLAQAALLLLTGTAFLLNDDNALNPGVLLLIFAGWQLMSLLIHLFAGPRPWKMKAWRKYHLLGIGLVLLMLVIAVIQSDAARTGDKDDKYSMAGLGTAIFAVIPAILVSLFYVIITFREWQRTKTNN